jgi:hypothetical protein
MVEDLKENKEQPVVCVSSLIRNRSWILPQYLDHLYRLNYNKKQIVIYWLINNSTDSSEKLLFEFKQKHEQEYRQIIVEKVKNSNAPEYKRTITKSISAAKTYWKQVYENLARLRNKVIDKVLELDEVEWLFNIDSDILVNPNDLSLLVNSNKDIVAGIISNDGIRNPNLKVGRGAACNILNFDERGKAYHITEWENGDNPLISVDCTGAIAIYRKEIFRNPDLRYGFSEQGEDIYFFKKVKEYGIKVYAHTGCTPVHVMGIMQDICQKCDKQCKQFSFQDGERKGILVTCPKFKEIV